jgi:rSAM/selenodomain-associated transferase 1
MDKAHFIIFAKPPHMGLSKTRLARDIGPTEAKRLNMACHAKVMRAVTSGRWHTTLCISPDTQTGISLNGLWPSSLERMSQGQGDLGQRLERAISKTSAGPVFVIGTDTPQLSAALLGKATQLIRRNDVVIGPADDGGFWLLGMSHRFKAHHLRLNPIRWSSSHTLSDLKALFPNGTRISYLPTLIDLDDESALRKLKNQP